MRMHNDSRHLARCIQTDDGIDVGSFNNSIASLKGSLSFIETQALLTFVTAGRSATDRSLGAESPAFAFASSAR